MFNDFKKPKRVREPVVTLTWHRCSHPKGMTHCKPITAEWKNFKAEYFPYRCDKGEVVK